MKKALLILLVFCILVSYAKAANLSEAKVAIENAENTVRELASLNISIGFFNSTLNSLKEDFSKGEYGSVLEKANLIESRKEVAYYLYDSMQSAKIRIEELVSASVEVTELKDILRRAEREFYYENYDEASKLVDELFKSISDVEAQQSILAARYEAARQTLTEFFKSHRVEIAISLASILVLIAVVYKTLERRAKQIELKTLVAKKKALERLIVELQRKRYVEDAVSKRFYQLMMEKYKSELRKVESRLLAIRKS